MPAGRVPPAEAAEEDGDESWPPDQVADEDWNLDAGIPDDPPDDPLSDDAAPEPLLDLDAPDDADDASWVPEDVPPEAELPTDPTDPLTLSWREVARLPEHDVEVPAILDPTVPGSTWTVPVHLPVATLDLLVEIGAFQARVHVVIREGRTAELRLGRDALAGKVLVRP